MLKKEKNKIILSPGAEKIIRSFCRANNRDINEFLEEAIVEKIEFEELNKDNIRTEAGENAVVEELFVNETGSEEFKRKH
jgi:hypothetical protein